MRDAMLIAAEEINERGGLLGRPVELIIVDSEGLPERGTAVMEKLINQDNVVAVGGGYHSSVGVARHLNTQTYHQVLVHELLFQGHCFSRQRPENKIVLF